jgi:AraC-like DNA-binding protein
MRESSTGRDVSACMKMPTSTFAADRAALQVRRLVRGDGFVVDDVHCTARRGTWSEPERASGYAFVLTRSGCFERRTNGAEMLVDAALAYFREPGEEQQVAHPSDCGDRCTSIGLTPAIVASLWGGDPSGLPAATFSTPALDLAHRRLLATCRGGASATDVEELVVNIVSAALVQHSSRRLGSGRATSAAARRQIVRDARQLLADDPTRTLRELARQLAVSPHHLSRIFSSATGTSVTAYRNRLRTRTALERIADGERSLTRLAAELGFTDHAHLTRTIHRETGLPPSIHRRNWGATNAK